MFTLLAGIVIGWCAHWVWTNWEKYSPAPAQEEETREEVATATPVTPRKPGRPKKTA